MVRSPLMCLVALVAIGACKDDPVAPVMQSVDFPALDPTVQQIFCIRGQLSPTTSTQGVIAFSRNCPRLEAWRVRVERPTRVEFLVTSAFNSALGLFHIPDIDDYTPGNPIVEDDNSGLNRDARIQHQLEPDTEYAIVVVGSNAEDTGPYTLDVTALD